MTKPVAHLMDQILAFAFDSGIADFEIYGDVVSRFERFGDEMDKEQYEWLKEHHWMRLAPYVKPPFTMSAATKALAYRALKVYTEHFPGSCAICGCSDTQKCAADCTWVPDPACLNREVCSCCELKASQA